MAIRSNNNLPFTYYTVKNESSRGVNVFMGVSSKKNNLTSEVDYFPHHVIACKTTYLFASIVGTRNVKITRPTTTDPYIYVQTRQVEPQQVKDLEATSFLKSGNSSGMTLRRLSSDSSIVINDNDCNYGLNTFTYKVQNVCSINGLFYKTYGSAGKTNVVWQFKEIEGDPPCVDVVQNGGEIIFVNRQELCCWV